MTSNVRNAACEKRPPLLLRRRCNLSQRGNVGFTLIEMLVAIGLLSMLGLMLITKLRETLDITTTGVTRGEAYARAQSVLAQVESDLIQISSREGGRLISGQDPMGRMFLAFVRSLPEEREMRAGIYAGESRMRRGQNDASWRGMAADGRFRALGGLCEVCYVMEPEIGATELYRGIVSPIYEPGPLGQSAAIASMPAGAPNRVIGDMEYWHVRSGTAVPAAAAGALRDDRNFAAKYQMLSDKVLYLGFEFWTGTTQSWIARGIRGPVHYWESAPQSRLWNRLVKSWPRRNPEFSDDVARDMDYPRAVRVVITMQADRPVGTDTTLSLPMNADDTVIPVADAAGFPDAGRGNNFCRIDDEWVEYGSVDGNTLYQCRRGARGTKAQAHTPGARVLTGLTFSRVVTLPVGR